MVFLLDWRVPIHRRKPPLAPVVPPCAVISNVGIAVFIAVDLSVIITVDTTVISTVAVRKP